MSLAGKLRRIALERQGLLKRDSFGRGIGALRRAIESLGYVQIDTISVVARAHHHVLWSRMRGYRPEMLEQLVRRREVFEYWFHAAAWLPMRDYRFALPRMRMIDGERNWSPHGDRRLQREILARIEADGPLRARDFADPGHRGGGWWEWKPAKLALEQLFMQGELMVSRRDGFQKVYDLPERVLPEWVDTRAPDRAEFAEYLIDTSLRAHGFATQISMTYLRKGRALRDAVGDHLAARVAAGELARVECPNGMIIYIEPRLLDGRAPRSRALASILSPFDNAVIQRRRVREVFAFDYQIECYLPAGKRRFGYFSLPIVYRDRFVGRVDCKAHRRQARLEVRSLHMERAPDEQFAAALADELREFAGFNGCEAIDLGETARERPWREELLARL